MLPDDVWLIAMIVGVAILALCVCCVAIELRQCQKDWVEEAERKRRTKLSGIDPDHPAIELIGKRPDNERPYGVDWTISMWADERGQYSPSDRGFGSKLVSSAYDPVAIAAEKKKKEEKEKAKKAGK